MKWLIRSVMVYLIVPFDIPLFLSVPPVRLYLSWLKEGKTFKHATAGAKKKFSSFIACNKTLPGFHMIKPSISYKSSLVVSM